MKKYEFKPYKSNYPNLFNEEKSRLSKYLTGNYQIEHVGSTSIPGLGGKGIIDIMIATSKDQMQNISDQAQKADYIFRPLASTETRIFLRTTYPKDFSKDNAYHLHITFFDSKDWKETIAFRDYLRTHKEESLKYAVIKKQAAEASNENTEKYNNMKKNILTEILTKALTLN